MLDGLAAGNRLSRFISQFGQLNFADDREMAAQLDAVRQEFLTREAGAYRDSQYARQSLVNGLECLRAEAQALAAQPASDLGVQR